MNEERLEESLRLAAAVTTFPVSPALKSRTLARLPLRRTTWRLPAVAAAVLLMLALVPATMLATGEPVLGVQVTVSKMSPAQWLREGFRDWLASPGPPERLSAEETARVATFPIRTPAWLPDGMEALSEPLGYFAMVHSGGKWRQSEHFHLSQSFRDGDRWASVDQRERGDLPRGYVLAPGTEQITVAGHPAFLQREVPMARADADSEERSRRGEHPAIVSYHNSLEIWVEEESGSVTVIQLFGNLDPEELIRMAESLF